MAFVDELKIHIRAGHGGDGVVRWLHEKGRDLGGPSGGDGGRGAHVYVRGVHNVHLLSKYRHEKEFAGEDGGDGARDKIHGKSGDDLVIDLPVGSTVTNTSTGASFSLLVDGEKIMILQGGAGGRGNYSFKSSTNRSPEQFTLGGDGEEADFLVELSLIADAGLAGLPNAGKSSLLNALTRAKAQVGAYAFTTLEPNLGEFHGYILADIPGLIEGASEGKGLGHRFLRHITRTKIILHLVSLENENPKEAYEIVRKEIEKYGKELSGKKEIIVLTKTDMVSLGEIERAKKELAPLKRELWEVSVLDDNQIKTLADNLTRTLRELEESKE